MSDEGKATYWPGSFRTRAAATAVARLGAHRATVVVAARWRHGRAGSGCRLRSHELAPDPQRVGRPLRGVVGTDIDEHLLDAARSFLEAEGISNVDLVVDDLFESKLEPRSFDLVHGRS